MSIFRCKRPESRRPCRHFPREATWLRFLYGLILICLLAGCGDAKSSKSKKVDPAKLEKHPNESDIYRIILTERAEQRLGITTAKAELRAVPRHRTLGGEIVVPDGSSVFVTTPVTGTLVRPNDDQILVAGLQINAGQTVFHLLPLIGPEREVPTAAERVQMANARASLISSQIIAAGDVKQAAAQVKAAQITLARAKRLQADRVGSDRDVDDAVATLNVADEALKAAQARKELLDKLTLEAEAETGDAKPIPIIAPQDGVVRTVTATVGQAITVGTPLFEIVNLDRLWIRVPVYVGMLEQIDTQRAAEFDRFDTLNRVSVNPVAAPPTADALSTTVDLYYFLDNSNRRYRPGERVRVTLPLTVESESLVVPRAAILYDVHGVEWVYVKSGDHEFRRRRVQVKFVIDDLAVLSPETSIGEEVVVDGVAELFGTEFGAGK